jgi:hypothetical protein
MATTDNLAITEVAPNQDQKETTINNGLNQLDNATQGVLAISFAANARTLTATEFTNHLDFQLGTLTAAGTLTIPNTKRMFVVDNRTSGFSCTVTNGSGATIVVPSGVMTILRNNGTDVVAPTSLLTSAGVTNVVGSGEIVASPTVGAVALSLASIASGHLIANTSTVTAAPGDASLSALLDLAFGSVEGDVIYRGATAWAALVAGTSGEFLQTQGTAAPPQWAAVSGGGGGTVTDVATSGAGISGGPITSTGTLTVEWNAGSVTALGAGLSLNSGTLTASGGAAPEWTAGTVTAVGTGLSVVGGTLEATAATPEWSAGTVTAISTSFTIAAGTLAAASIASGSLMANVSGSPGAPAAVTTQVFLNDVIGSGTGVVMVRNVGGWGTVAIPAGGLLGRQTVGGNPTIQNVASFVANGTVAVSLTAVAPTGAGATPAEWLSILDATGVTRFIPCF